ncbi:MAG: triose-phosphate isomerase [Pseudomonadales bacterium]|nr:triose-phosphate isomerase [Pseudomonadales bacterium]
MDPLVVANWKMNGSEQLLQAVVQQVDGLAEATPATVVLALPAAYLSLTKDFDNTRIEWAGQNVHWLTSGAYTGEVSAAMLAELGVGWCLVGHSERRQHCAETDDMVLAKTKACLELGIRPIVCVGENLQERQAGKAAEVVSRQLLVVLKGISSALAPLIVVAYEPVWAIGTGEEASPEIAQEVHEALKHAARSAVKALELRVLYGGSVNADNVKALMSMPDIDGVLVGGASLEALGFRRICEQVAGSV